MSERLPQITTIIPTYRRPKLLRRAIQSVLNQTYTDFQICIYDNASGDETAAVVAEFSQKDSRVKYFCQPENIGAIGNFNHGLSKVETPYFSFLSDDDVLLPRFYEIALAGFVEHPAAIFSAGEVIEMTPEGEILKAPLNAWAREGYFEPPEGMFEMIRVKQPIMTGILFRLQMLQEFGLFDPTLAIGDYDLELRIAARFPFVISRELCAIFVLQSSSTSVSLGDSFLYNGYPKVLDNIRTDSKIAPEIRNEGANRLEAWLKRLTFRTALHTLSTKNFSEVRKLAQLLETQYQMTKQSRFLYRLTWLFERVPLFSTLLAQVYKFRKERARKKRQPLQEQFGNAVRYLEL